MATLKIWLAQATKQIKRSRTHAYTKQHRHLLQLDFIRKEDGRFVFSTYFTFGMEAFAILINFMICMAFALFGANGADVGDLCQVARSGAQGVCQLINSCQPVIDQIVSQGLYPAQCGFRGRDQIVCCPVPPTTTTTTTLRPDRISQRSELHTTHTSAGCHVCQCQCHDSNGNGINSEQ